MYKLTVFSATLALTAMCQPGIAITWIGYSTSLPGTSLAARPELAGKTIGDQSLPFRGTDGSPLVLHNWVVRESAAGTLDFYVQFSNPNPDATTTVALNQLVLTGFDVGPSLDVDFRTDLGGSDSFFAARAMATQFLPDQLDVGSPARGTGVWLLSGGETLPAFFVHTSATDFAPVGSLTQPVLATAEGLFAPVPAGGVGVPEPGALALLPLAMIALGLRLRSRW